MTLPVAPINRDQRRSLARRGTALGGAGVVLAGSAAALLTAFAGTAGATATITVDSNGDGAADAAHCTDGTPNNCTLRDAAAAAVEGDTITFDPSINTITLTNGRIDTLPVSIVGPGSSALTITTAGVAGAYDMFRFVGNGDALISGVTLTKNRVKSNNTGNFTIDDVTVSGSSGTYGGALYGGNGSDLFITNSRFENNHSNDNAGAVYIYNGQNATISGTVFVDNDSDGRGGAVYSAYAQNITIIDTQFDGNSTTERGGAMSFSRGVEGVITISDCTLDSNSSSQYGGGVDFNADVTTVISNTTVSNNTAAGGAGLNFDESGINATINNSTITANTVANGGAGVYINAGSSLTINQSTITANTANGTATNYGGGGISIGGADTVLTLSGTIVSGNSSGVAGAADFGLYTSNPADTGSFTSTNSIIGEVESRITHNGTNDINSTNPMLGALTDNGGATKTMAPLPGSPAINAGPNPVATFGGNEFDQRGPGFARVSGGLVDIGAFEIQVAPDPVVPIFAG